MNWLLVSLSLEISRISPSSHAEYRGEDAPQWIWCLDYMHLCCLSNISLEIVDLIFLMINWWKPEVLFGIWCNIPKIPGVVARGVGLPLDRTFLEVPIITSALNRPGSPFLQYHNILMDDFLCRLYRPFTLIKPSLPLDLQVICILILWTTPGRVGVNETLAVFYRLNFKF